ncbi:MAG: rhomboid family intramembrane serine protease [Nanoarchaeota archaeon]
MRIIRNHQRRGGFFFDNASVTNKLIVVNVLLFVFFYFFSSFFGAGFFETNIALTPSLIFAGKSLWTFFTSMFMHAGLFHLFANMFSLFFIGNFLEKIIGRKRLFLIYILSGLSGGIFFVLSGLIFSNDIPGVGASGAIFGLLGILSVLVPYSKIYLIAGPLIVILAQVVLIPIIPANFAVILNIFLNILIFGMIFAMFSFNPNFRKFAIPIELRMWLLPIVAIVPLVIIDFIGVDLPIGNSAHIGGLVVGLAYGFYLRKKFPNKTRMLSRHFQ